MITVILGKYVLKNNKTAGDILTRTVPSGSFRPLAFPQLSSNDVCPKNGPHCQYGWDFPLETPDLLFLDVFVSLVLFLLRISLVFLSVFSVFSKVARERGVRKVRQILDILEVFLGIFEKTKEKKDKEIPETFRKWATPPVRLGLSGGNSGKNSGKTPETLSERFLEFPSRVRLGCPKPYNSRHLRLPERFQTYLPPSTAGDASFFRIGSGEGLSELVMEFPAVLGVFLRKDPGNALRAFPGIPLESMAAIPQTLYFKAFEASKAFPEFSPAPVRLGDASFFRSGSGEGLSELVMEVPAILRAF